ncbi:mechanosensitive ion channel protein MscS [Mesobacillus campisalis]|uniref:Mechanosensitive ion channel protein MscS n=1 Tax=Mesobacillus campisalis TaxID=1408103 RepID=A0A0M2T3V6_9BACI|nr:mechanosensitive ion channel domain-containing protein [Mesobacillus campisalis]KKK39485.1 mechanosensitive ion channel protein MscS [Mesobacillus campisalis]
MLDFIVENFTASDIIQFILYMCFILAGKWLLRLGATYLARSRPGFQEKYLPSFLSMLNWVTFYGIVFLFLFYFSNSEWLFYPLYSQGGVDVTLFLIILAFMIVSLAHRAVKLFIKYVLSSVYEYYQIERGLSYTLSRVLYYTVMVAALAFSFTSVGIDLTALGAFLGVLGIGIGFGLRNVAGNFISGLIMLFERPVEVGEVIQINDKIGRIERVRMRSTVVRTAKEGTLIVPNQYFIEQIIKNRTGAVMMAQVTVSVVFGTDSKRVEQLLGEAVENSKEDEEGILKATHAEIRFIDLRNRAMEFQVELPVASFEIKERVESKLRHAIVECFTKNGIELAPAELDLSLLNKR